MTNELNANAVVKSVSSWLHTLREADDDRTRRFADLLQFDLEALFDHLHAGGATPSWSFAAELLRREPLQENPYKALYELDGGILQQRISRAQKETLSLGQILTGADLLAEVERLRHDKR